MQKLELASFILRGKNRVKIMKSLEKGKLNTVEIRKNTNIHKSHLNRVLNELQGKKLIKNLTPKETYFRFYELTNLGRKVVEEITEQHE